MTNTTGRSCAYLCPIRIKRGRMELLLVRRVFYNSRKKRPLRFPGEWTFPGGKRDPEDKTLLATAIREFREELNCTGKVDGTFFLRRGRQGQFTITFFAAYTDPKMCKIIDEDTADYAWKTPHAWLALLASERFTHSLEREYRRRGFADKKFGKFSITKRDIPAEHIATIRLIQRREKQLLQNHRS
jgi:8-oxo-dGTP pyrophosphatase MutT (NUDIX family)